MSISVGTVAPDFTLYADDKKTVSLQDFRGKNVLLLFFPQAFTSVCTAELCDARDNLHQYQALNAQILAISVDSVFTLAQFKAGNEYNFPLLSDFNKEVSPKYGAFYENFVFGMKGVSKRAAFVVDKVGVVQYAEILENAGKIPNFKAIQACLEQLGL
jgi:glutaredoxin-dependent peroxiredoxin